MADEPILYVADAGSVSKGNFHWISSRSVSVSSDDPQKLASAIAGNIMNAMPVALGYESPLFVPEESDKDQLGRARKGECEEATGNRSFNAGAGASVLATGLQCLAWLLREIKRMAPNATATTKWGEFREGRHQLFIWEAFVTGSEKAFPPSHAGDAALAIDAFRRVMANVANPTRVPCTSVFSLVGAAIIWAELSTDLALLSEPCVVLRPIFPREESQQRLTDYKRRQAEAKKAKLDRKKQGSDK